LREAASRVRSLLKEGQFEHGVRQQRARYAANCLARDIEHSLARPKRATQDHHQRHGGIEVSARDWRKSGDQHEQDGRSRRSVGEQR